MRPQLKILCAVFFAVLGLNAHAAPQTRIQLFLAADTARAGDTVLAGVHLQMPGGWHTYAPDPENSGQATEIKWQLPPGVTAGDIQWPAAEKSVADGLTSYLYNSEVILLIPLRLAADLKPGPLELKAKISWIECLESCVPGNQEVAATLTVGNETKPSAAAATLALWEKKPVHALPSAAPAAVAPATAPVSLWTMLLFAFVGGLILNLMPCVLPVIALKILGFVSRASEQPARVRKLGLIYAGGVLVSFLALAALVIAVQSTGHRASWGMQFSNPPFLVALTALVTLVALNLFGVFEVTLGGGAMDAAGKLVSKHGAAGAFFNGVLTTVLATPCTAPFLAPALGFAFAQPPGVVVLFFAAIAAGLALPYVALTWQPAWLKFLPKPGAWMERFKIAMGFPMLATAVWLYDVASAFYGELARHLPHHPRAGGVGLRRIHPARAHAQKSGAGRHAPAVARRLRLRARRAVALAHRAHRDARRTAKDRRGGD
ncbi:MAG: protein-disulfide reductase DsbD family protein [Verrucomicrobia bacterium]|nr:protein-disulfide reductase DsbD family protein [Verrucomicrobiota bacterium]